jgi:hypothetical protein
MTPPKLAGNGKDFEDLLLQRAANEEKRGVLTMSRYGVQVTMIEGEWRPVPSLPDFDGALANGRQFIIEAKVCAGPSFELRKDKLKPRQVAHMLTRSAFGVPCFLLIHFNERKLVRSADPAFTVAIPVNDSLPLWRAFVDAHAVAKRTKQPVEPQGSISREMALRIGVKVEWNVAPGCRTVTPDLAALLCPETIQQPSLF